MKTYKHLDQQDRELIILYLNQGKSLRTIAAILKRSHRTIAREISRNKKEDVYFAYIAQRLARTRRLQARRKSRKLDDFGLRGYVIKRIGKGDSPEQIAGRL